MLPAVTSSSPFRLVLPLLLVACGPTYQPRPDAGTDAPPVDAYRPPPVPYTCEGDMEHVVGVMDETASLTFDTTMTAERPRDLGACGNFDTTAVWAPQEVIEYVVPGTGRISLSIDTRFPETPVDFNTLVQLRTGGCEVIPTQVFPPTCLDDASTIDARAAGAIMVDGGSTVYLVVTAFSDPPAAASQVDEGVVRIDIRPHANTPPTIDEAAVVLAGTDDVDATTLVDLTVSDPDGPPGVYGIGFFTAAGRYDLTQDGVRDGNDILVFGLDRVTGSGPYAAEHEITPADDRYRIAEFCRSVDCTQAALVVLDRDGALSPEVMVPIEEAVIVGRDMPCDRTHVCIRGLTCIAGICTR